MSQIFHIHPDNPQSRLIRQAVGIIRNGGVIVYPTDSGYALGSRLGDKAALQRIRSIRQLDDNHKMTLMCRDLSQLSVYAKFDNAMFRLMKGLTPGPYTFLLMATREVPRQMLHPKRRTLGLRVPDHMISLALLDALEAPLLSTSLILPDNSIALSEPEAIRDILGSRVDLIIDGGNCGVEPTTIVDLTKDKPEVVREGKGDISLFQKF